MAEPLHPPPPRIPSGQEVERLCVAMCTAVGWRWDVMEQDQKFTIRIMAAAAFPHFGLTDTPPPTYNPDSGEPDEAV